MITENSVHPYKILSQSGTSLQLKAGSGVKAIRFIFLLMPLFLVIIGIALYVSERDVKFLYILGGIALLEVILFSFLKLPADVQFDRMGFTLQTVSIRGTQQTDYLWADVDRIRQHIQSTKNGKMLSYEAMLKNGKKPRFLNFNNYNPKQQSVEDINAWLRQISGKEVEVKA